LKFKKSTKVNKESVMGYGMGAYKSKPKKKKKKKVKK